MGLTRKWAENKRGLGILESERVYKWRLGKERGGTLGAFIGEKGKMCINSGEDILSW